MKHVFPCAVISFSWLVSCLRVSSAWSGQSTSRRSLLHNHILLPITGTFSYTPSESALAVEVDERMTNDATISNGVLWRTITKQALPATPSSLKNIMDIEIMGTMSTASSGMICISERHDDFEHHKVQLKVLMTMKKVLSERAQNVGESLSIGMEMFQRRHQKFLDKYIEDSAYSARHLQRDCEWDQTWGYDILHYLPIISFAKKHNIRIVGLHPSDEEVEYVERKSILEFGGCEELTNAAITHFREEYMAERAALQMNRQPFGWVALLAGEKHIMRRDGLPSRVLRTFAGGRTKFSKGLSIVPPSRGVYTIVPKVISFPLAAKDTLGIESADYVWYVQRDPSVDFREDKVNNAPRIGA